jgi:hypothetical protein
MVLKIYSYDNNEYKKLPIDYLNNNLWDSVVLDSENRLCLVKDHKKYLKNKFNLEYDAKLISTHPILKSEIFINFVNIGNIKRIYYAGYKIKKDQYALLEWLSIKFEYELYKVNTWYWHITRIQNPKATELHFVNAIHRNDSKKVPVFKLMYSPPTVDVL